MWSKSTLKNAVQYLLTILALIILRTSKSSDHWLLNLLISAQIVAVRHFVI
jgi:hypothetical protein